MTQEQINNLYFIRKINGIPIYKFKFPQQEIHDWHTVDKDSGRLSNGKMERHIVGYKNEFTITFPPTYLETFRNLVKMFSNDIVTLEYEHFFSGNIVTSEFYRADLKKERVFIDTSNHDRTIMEKLTVSLIEM